MSKFHIYHFVCGNSNPAAHGNPHRTGLAHCVPRQHTSPHTAAHTTLSLSSAARCPLLSPCSLSCASPPSPPPPAPITTPPAPRPPTRKTHNPPPPRLPHSQPPPRRRDSGRPLY